MVKSNEIIVHNQASCQSIIEKENMENGCAECMFAGCCIQVHAEIPKTLVTRSNVYDTRATAEDIANYPGVFKLVEVGQHTPIKNIFQCFVSSPNINKYLKHVEKMNAVKIIPCNSGVFIQITEVDEMSMKNWGKVSRYLVKRDAFYDMMCSFIGLMPHDN